LAGVTASIVLYKHGPEEVFPLFDSLARDPALSDWVIVNNGGAEAACEMAAGLGARCLDPGRNLGFGAGHNLALRAIPSDASYHLIVNPDIRVPNGVLAELGSVMDSSPHIGLVMPKVLYPDGTIQYLCKLLPTPFDLLLRRFAGGPWRRLFANRMSRYDMRSFDYDHPVYVPVLSGCFMFARRSVLDAIGGFDERFFLYMEDTDLCRRLGDVSRLLFWPHVTVIHGHAQGSYRNLRMLRLHARAAVKYFDKWGWFRDPVRAARNRMGLQDASIDINWEDRPL
jgi:GT2 family glycosyltransferase